MNLEVTGHKPVLLKELVDAIKPKENEIYFDATFGDGGYSSKLLETTNCQVIAIDQDPFVQTKAKELLNLRKFWQTLANFRKILIINFYYSFIIKFNNNNIIINLNRF